MDILVEANSKEKFEQELEDYKNKFSAWLQSDELRAIKIVSQPVPVEPPGVLNKIKEVLLG